MLTQYEYRGRREARYYNGFSVSSPPAYKYLTCVTEFNTPTTLAAALTQQGGAYNAQGEVFINSTSGEGTAGTNEYLITGSDGVPNNVTPWSIAETKVEYHIRNNHTTACNLTIFEIMPRQVLPKKHTDIYPDDQSAYAFVMRSIAQGIAEKASTSAMQTTRVVNVHTENNASLSNKLPAFADQPQFVMEMSLHSPLTIFDSDTFTGLFKVVKVMSYHLEPTDTLRYTAYGPKVDFPEGIEPYLGSDAGAYEFSKFVFFQLEGDPAHSTQRDVAHAPMGRVTAKSTENYMQGYNICMSAETFLDVLMVKTNKFDTYVAELTEPLVNVNVTADIDYGEMKDVVFQAVADNN